MNSHNFFSSYLLICSAQTVDVTCGVSGKKGLLGVCKLWRSRAVCGYTQSYMVLFLSVVTFYIQFSISETVTDLVFRRLAPVSSDKIFFLIICLIIH